MKFIKSFFISALVACTAYYAAVLLLIDAPISAEYWVAEMIAVKKELVHKHAGKRRIIILGGSSTLFNVNAEYASERLNMPVINFGLHAGLRLERILSITKFVAVRGDILILPLEPPYYDCHSRLGTWKIRNTIGWDHDGWKEMSFSERVELVYLVSPLLLGEMFTAEVARKFYPSRISARLDALDNSLVLTKFRIRSKPTTFNYSAYNLNDHGDILLAEGAKFTGSGFDYEKPDYVCDKTASLLINFVNSMKIRGVQVYFANTPYIATTDGLDALREGESIFRKEFANIGCFIDSREDLIFDRKYFFNTNLHLNTIGRQIRTNLLIQAIREKVLPEVCT